MKTSEFGQFLRLLAHDLQNQLGAVDLNLQIMPTLVADGDPTLNAMAPFLNRAALASADLVATLQDVQSFAHSVDAPDAARVTGQELSPDVAKCDLSSKVRDCALILASIAKDRDITLKTSIRENVFATGDGENIRRAIKTLASEALRSSFPDSTVELNVLDKTLPTIEIMTTQDGLFEESRAILAVFLARQFLESSVAKFIFVSEPEKNGIQLVFRPV